MNRFRDYVTGQLDKHLREHGTVVFYDPRRQFEGLIDTLPEIEPRDGYGGLPCYWVQDLRTHIARFDGSYFALKLQVEPVFAMHPPQKLLVYLPGEERDLKGSILMELERAGTFWEPQLRRLAINVLRKNYTDGEIDDMLSSESLGFRDIERLVEQPRGGESRGSMLKVVLGEGPSEELIARWLAVPERDSEIEAKQATAELRKLVASRVGLDLADDAGLSKQRHQLLRYLLVDELRGDLRAEPPAALGTIPATPTQDHHRRAHDILRRLRRDHAAFYTEQADAIEDELRLTTLGFDPPTLGSLDTFRFEERLLLDHAAGEIAAGRHHGALEVAGERAHSFWVDRDLDSARWAQWELCRRAAELAQEVDRVRPEIKRAGEDPRKWVEAYAAPAGWSRVDRAQRMMEFAAAHLEDAAEGPMEKALAAVRRGHEALLEEMARGFGTALEAAGWTVPGVLHQTRVFPEVVEAVQGRVAYFLVDAMRFEMGQELTEQLASTEDLRLVPAITVLPSITPLGMAALLPEAAGTFTVVDSGGSLAAEVDGSVLKNLPDRRKFLVARRPGAVDVELGDLLQKPPQWLERTCSSTDLLIVRSIDLDYLGENQSGLVARQTMDTVIGNLAKAVRRLSRIGFERFVITADHGHLFSRPRESDMLLEKPGGKTVDLHRRCWAGHGGQTAEAVRRVTAEQLGYHSDLDFLFPRGLAVFKAGGDLAYHHGGATLQEMVIPVLNFRIPQRGAPEDKPIPAEIRSYPDVITNRTFGVELLVRKDLFSEDLVAVRLVLVADGEEVGRAGMAVAAELDRSTSVIQAPPGVLVSVGMLLSRDDVKHLRIVAQDPDSDRILGQTDEIPLKLGI